MSLVGENSSSRILPMRTSLLTRLNTSLNRNSLVRCPFCSRYGHNVIDCNDAAFMTISASLIHMKINIMNDNNISYNDKKDVLCSLIRNNAERSTTEGRRLKCYAIRNCNVRDEDDYFTWSMKICDKIYNMTNDEETTILNNQNSPDFLEFHENDAVSYLIDADNLIRANSMDMDRNEERIGIQSDSRLRMLSLLAQIRMDEMLNEITGDEITGDEIVEGVSIEDNKYSHKVLCTMDTNHLHNENEIPENEINIIEQSECSICYETKDLKLFVNTNCGHSFCHCCMKQTMNSSIELKCPLCRTKISSLTCKNKEICENF
jgi:hypothetical protein